MIQLHSLEDFNLYNLYNLENGNRIIGLPKEFEKSKITINGNDNLIILENGVKIHDSTIELKGNNSLVYICKAKESKTRVYLTIFNDSVFFLGRDNYTTKTIRVVVSEGKNVFIGSECLFSFGIWIRNSDAHSIFDTNTNSRTNHAKSIYIGDHVWFGQEVFIGKGSKVGSGAIVGARSFVTREIQSNSIAVGIPVEIARKDTFWDRPSVHSYDSEIRIEKSIYKSDAFIYKKDSKTLYFSEIEKNLLNCESVDEKYLYLKNNFVSKKYKNRFFIAPPLTKKQKIKHKLLKFIPKPIRRFLRKIKRKTKRK